MRIFRNKNFTLMFIGRIITNIGDSLYLVAAMWLVYDLGGSSFYTGLAGFLSILPRLVQLFSGPFIDRLPIKGILVYSQLIQAFILLIVPLAYYLNFLSVFLVLFITPILNICNSWVYPVQMSALPKIVKKEQLTQGNSLFSVAYQGIDVACNAISGILIVAIGAVSLYFWNAMSFFISALIFSQLKIVTSRTIETKQEETKQEEPRLKILFSNYKQDLLHGIGFITRTSLSTLLFGVIVINAACGATMSILPVYSDNIGGPKIYGFMLMAIAVGNLLGALCAPYLKLEKFKIGYVYATAFVLSGVTWVLSVFSPWTWLVILIFGLAWFPGGAVGVLINTVIQRGIPSQYLGLVFAATMALSGIAYPLGSLIGGILGLWLKSSYVIALSGCVIFLVGVYWFTNRTSRQLPKAEHIHEGLFTPKGKNKFEEVSELNV